MEEYPYEDNEQEEYSQRARIYREEGEEKSPYEKKVYRRKRRRKQSVPLSGIVARAAIFGLVAAIVFLGVIRVSYRWLPGLYPASLPDVRQTNLLDAPENTDTAGEISSGEEPDDELTQIVLQKGTVAGVAKTAMPSVVAITSVSIQEIQSFFGIYHDYASTGSGSGILVGENDRELLIATNYHVVEGAATLNVFFYGDEVIKQSGGYVEGGQIDLTGAVTANIKGTDEDHDLAVISVEKALVPERTMEQIRIARLGNSEDLVVGEQVVAIGNALGYGQTVTSGWISALNRSISRSDGTIANLIQTDAAINPGNSGGALLNMRGEVIGINSAKYASSQVEGTGFAIPISTASPILENLMTKKTRNETVPEDKAAYLGVQLQDLSQEAVFLYNLPTGAFVSQVTEGGPADLAGILPRDIILRLDGVKVSGKDDLIDMLSYYESGETVKVALFRYQNGRYGEQTVEVTFGNRE